MGDQPLPQLPGFSFRNPTQTHFPRTARLGTNKDVPDTGTVNDEEMDQLSDLTRNLTYQTTTRSFTDTAALPMSKKPQIPAHVALDKQTLTFEAYFKETVTESSLEHFRVRYVKIFYYLEDDTMSVLEPLVPNSGLPQGKLIRRQRLPKGGDGDVWSWKDLNVAVNVTFYGKTFRITRCDKFTEEFLRSNGIELNGFEDPPNDSYTKGRRTIEQPSTLATTKDDYDKLKQFIDLDRKVLRFYVVWDDRASLFGELRRFTLLYFLVDDTIEIREQNEANSGRDNFPLLLRRQRVPLNPNSTPRNFPKIVMETGKNEDGEYIGPENLGIGVTINVLSRNLLLVDCDGFTKEFYKTNFGVEDFSPIEIEDPEDEPAELKPPPETGFGSHEDSMQSVLSLKPKPPKANMAKLLEFGNDALRFTAHLDTDDEIDAEREFIVIYKLAMDIVSIFEKKTKTRLGGKFLEGIKLKTPDSPKHNPQYYGDYDFYPGRTINVYHRLFVLDDCDLSVLKFMHENIEQYDTAVLADVSARTGYDFDLPIEQ
eukprot:m.58902 g.58902  ORF g.58902 m.58902 type:complete len:539 (+) comp7888_c0_seq1:33-1649(+)